MAGNQEMIRPGDHGPLQAGASFRNQVPYFAAIGSLLPVGALFMLLGLIRFAIPHLWDNPNPPSPRNWALPQAGTHAVPAEVPLHLPRIQAIWCWVRSRKQMALMV
jgi:hypothetical protein